MNAIVRPVTHTSASSVVGKAFRQGYFCVCDRMFRISRGRGSRTEAGALWCSSLI